MNFFAGRRAEALQEVAAWASRIKGSVKLSPEQLRALGFTSEWDGWRLPLERNGSVDLLIDQDFPYSVPRMSLVGRPDLLLAPHVEKGGKLCLEGESGRSDSLRPAEVAAHCYQEALALVGEDEAGGNRDDYRLDFSAYWRRELDDTFEVRLWLGRDLRSRQVAAWHGQSFIFVAETEEDCSSWLNNRFTRGEAREYHPALVVGLNALPEPEEYPVNGGKLRKLVALQAPGAVTLFDRFMLKMPKKAVVVLAGRTAAGEPAWAPVIIRDGLLASGGKSRAGANRGFRLGKKPASLLVLDRTVVRASPSLVDAYLSRVDGGAGQALAGKRVAVLGCGSLGAGVSRILLQSGLGRLILVDPQNLGWENIGRHELGAGSVGFSKASELVKSFKPMYPHARELRAEPHEWQDVIRRNPAAFAGADLIISLIGDWNAEVALSDLQQAEPEFLPAPVLYGWLEEHAGAAHALAIAREGACFRCGFDATGGVKLPATKWSKGGPVACGGITSLYGAVELAPAQALVAGLALDLLLDRAAAPVRRTWLAPSTSVEANGGRWHPAWSAAFGEPGGGGKVVGAPWGKDAACPGCSQ